MSKSIGTPGKAAPPPAPTRAGGSSAAKTSDANRGDPPASTGKTSKGDAAEKAAQKRADAAAARRARSDMARTMRRTNQNEEPKEVGDFEPRDGDDGVEAQHRQKHVTTHKSFGGADDLDDLQKSEAEAETGAVTDKGVGRKGMGGGMGGDGFEGSQDKNREAYEQYLRGNVVSDAERFEQLRRGGTADTFRPELSPVEVEKLGTPRAATHLVRLYDQLTLEGRTHDECVARAKEILVGFTRPDSVRKVLQEMESRPIRDVYPLEVLLKILDETPSALPGVSRGAGVILNAAELSSGEKCFAGHPFTVEVPVEARIKAFALVGGARPGYEFFPAQDPGKYTMLIDTPGRWTFAVLCAPLTSLGRIQKEASEGVIVEEFVVTVHRMGKKGELQDPLLAGADDGDAVAADDDEVDGEDAAPTPPPVVAKAPSLAEQIRAALDAIVRHDEGLKTTTYSWDLTLRRPGAPMDAEPLLHVVVERATPVDVAWSKAADAIAWKQKEFEPSRKPISLVDVQLALKRARVR